MASGGPYINQEMSQQNAQRQQAHTHVRGYTYKLLQGHGREGNVQQDTVDAHVDEGNCGQGGGIMCVCMCMCVCVEVDMGLCLALLKGGAEEEVDQNLVAPNGAAGSRFAITESEHRKRKKRSRATAYRERCK